MHNYKVRHIVHIDNPHIKSYAALVLLNKSLMEQDVDFINSDRIKIVQNNIRFLKKKEEISILTCVYCSKTNLIIHEKFNKPIPKSSYSRLATVDHFYPISKGGSVYDEKIWSLLVLVAIKRKQIKKVG